MLAKDQMIHSVIRYQWFYPTRISQGTQRTSPRPGAVQSAAYLRWTTYQRYPRGVRLHPVLPRIGNINSCDIDGAWNLVDFLRRGHTFFNRGRSSNYLRDRTWLIRVRNGTVFKVLAFFKLGFNILIRIDGSGISHRRS